MCVLPVWLSSYHSCPNFGGHLCGWCYVSGWYKKEALCTGMCTGLFAGRRRRPTLPPGHPGSTIGAEELNFCVRNGNRWDLFAMATNISILVTIEQQGSFGLQKDMVKPHGSLVSVSSMCCHTSTSDLSTLSSSTSLQVAFATGYLILEGASRLDAFSGYPCRT